jgi:hypothetical protein
MQVGGNKNANGRPIGVDGKRDWSFGLFSCFDKCGLCTYLRTHTNASYRTFHMLTPFRTQAAGPPGARVSSIARTDSACAIYNNRALPCPVEAKDTTITAIFMADF